MCKLQGAESRNEPASERDEIYTTECETHWNDPNEEADLQCTSSPPDSPSSINANNLSPDQIQCAQPLPPRPPNTITPCNKDPSLSDEGILDESDENLPHDADVKTSEEFRQRWHDCFSEENSWTEFCDLFSTPVLYTDQVTMTMLLS